MSEPTNNNNSTTLQNDNTPLQLPPEGSIDEEDDNWSRQVETDLHHEDSFRLSVTDDTPRPPELSLKEKLVMRERERRIETERARLKRQFVLNNPVVEGPQAAVLRQHGTPSRVSESETLGEESIVAHPPDDDDEASAEERRLGFNMERFLRNSDSFNPQLETTREHEQDGGDDDSSSNVLLKRFLSEAAAVQESTSQEQVPEVDTAVQRSVSFDTDGLVASSSAPDTRASSVEESQLLHMNSGPVNSDVGPDSVEMVDSTVETAASLVVEPDTDDTEQDELMRNHSMDAGSDVNSSSAAHSTEEPRVLRLTEADMQEMAAIEEASIGNAPPSEREEEMLSEIGELAGFGGSQNLMPGNLSLDTPTTAVESGSQMSGNHSATIPVSVDRDHTTSEPRSVDGLVASSLSAGLGFPAATSANVPTTDDVLASNQQRDGQRQEGERIEPQEEQKDPGRSGVADEQSIDAAEVVVEGFDFDKHAPTSPLPVHSHDDSYRDLPEDEWSPRGKMGVSPLHPRRTLIGSYGATEDASESLPLIPMPTIAGENDKELVGESRPLLADVPPEIITRQAKAHEPKDGNEAHGSALPSKLQEALDDAISEVRSEKEEETVIVNRESEIYLKSSIIARALPERMFALTVTLLFEIPVLLMISGGSDSLCALIGRNRYQLLMAFLPLTSAISGNVGLQASTLTTRAISHNHVTSSSYGTWFRAEIGAAICLALCMGTVLGSLAFMASGMDYAFGITIFVAQVVSIVTAGFTGTMAPLLFSFIFKQDSGKWGGPLETAIQDIVGSFAMVIISYHILRAIGPGPIDPRDVCGFEDLR